MWRHTRRNQILSFGRVHLDRWGESVQSTAGSRGVRISSSNAGYTMFRGSVKSTGYPLHSPVSPSLPLPCVTVCHQVSTGLYTNVIHSITLCFKLSWRAFWVQLLTSGNSSMAIKYKNGTTEGLTVEITVRDRKYQVFQSDLQSTWENQKTMQVSVAYYISLRTATDGTLVKQMVGEKMTCLHNNLSQC